MQAHGHCVRQTYTLGRLSDGRICKSIQFPFQGDDHRKPSLIAVDSACQQERQSSITIVASSCLLLPKWAPTSAVTISRSHVGYANDPLQTRRVAPKSDSLAV